MQCYLTCLRSRFYLRPRDSHPPRRRSAHRLRPALPPLNSTTLPSAYVARPPPAVAPPVVSPWRFRDAADGGRWGRTDLAAGAVRSHRQRNGISELVVGVERGLIGVVRRGCVLTLAVRAKRSRKLGGLVIATTN